MKSTVGDIIVPACIQLGFFCAGFFFVFYFGDGVLGEGLSEQNGCAEKVER